MNDNLKTPPHSAEAERGVLGSILLDTETGDDSRVLDLCQSKGISPESFFVPRHRMLYETLISMSAAGLPIDPVTLNDRLRAQGRLDAVGGVAAIQELVDGTPTSAHAEYWIDIMRQKHLLRTLINRANETIARCYDESQSGNADVLLGEVEKTFLDIGGTASVSMDWKVAVDNTLHHIENMFTRGAGAMDGLPTGFKYIDEKLLGLKPAEMIVIAARPSVGKTSFAMNIAECVATGRDINGVPFKTDPKPTKHPVLIFSLEMDTMSLSKRMVCGRAHVSSWRIARDLMNRDEKTSASDRLFRAAGELKEAPIYIDDASGLDIADLRARARRMKKTHNIELIVIDYLQLCNCREMAKQGRQLETSRISGQIKAMAKELKIPVIVLSQLSRANEQRGDKNEVPKLSDLRDSGAIEQDADVVMLLRRPFMVRATREDEATQNLAIVDIAKHRNGEVGDVKMDFQRDFTRFGDYDPRQDAAGGSPAADEALQEAPPDTQPTYVEDPLI